MIRPIWLRIVAFGEPEVAVRAGRDADGVAVGRRDRELGDDAGRGDPPDLVGRDPVNQRLPSGPAAMP